MPDRNERLLELATAVADGEAVDWDTAESSAGTDSERVQIRSMRLIGEIGHAQTAPTSLTRPFQVVHESLLHPGQPREATGDSAPVSWGPLYVVEKIGRGRFGDVYRARDPKLDRDVALKLLRHRESDDAIESAVIEEGRFLAKIRHPNVVTVYGAERTDGRVGVWMELVRGRTLEQELIAKGTFSPEEVASIGRDLCGALSAVHRAGLVHRDVKGQNVMRDADGRIVLMDFGTGRELEMPSPAELAGTPMYLAPEVIRGQPASPQSDLYSLGVLLFHLLTGSFPVQGRTLAELRRAHEAGRRLTLREQREDLPSELAVAIEHALESRAEARPANAETLARSLAIGTTTRQSSSRRMAMASAVGLLVIIVAALKGWPGAVQPIPPVPGATRLVMTSPSFVINDISRDGRFGVGVDRADDTAAANLVVRDLTTGKMEELVHGSPENYALSPIWSPDSSEVAYRWTRRTGGAEVNFPSSLMVRRAVSGAQARTVRTEDKDQVITPLAWRPDGTAILVQIRPRFAGQRRMDDSLGWVTIADGSIETIRTFEWWQRAAMQLPRLSPDGRRIVYAANVQVNSTERHIYVIDSDGRNEREIVGLAGISDEPVWSPDGRRVLFISNRSGAPGLWSAAVDATDDPSEPVIVKPGFSGSPIAITASGLLYFSRKSGGDPMVFISDRHPSATSAVQMFMGEKPQWSHDGTALAMTRRVKDDGAVIVRTMATGREVPYPHMGLANQPRWLADDRELLVYVQAIGDNGRPGGSYYALDLRSGAFTWRFARNTTDHIRGSAHGQSADGSTIYMPYRGRESDASWAGIVAVDTTTGREKAAVKFPGGAIAADAHGNDMGLALSPDGKTLAVMTWTNWFRREARLILVDTDGRELRHLYGPFPADFTTGVVKWTPDGQSILFVVTHPSGLIQVMQISPHGGVPTFDGVDSRILTRFAPSIRLQPHGGLTLDVSPDGTKILLAISTFAEWETWTMDGLVPIVNNGQTTVPAR